MPIPKPTSNEGRQDFLKRCMGDDTMTSEYADTDQRLAVCTNEYDSYKENSTENKAAADALKTGDMVSWNSSCCSHKRISRWRAIRCYRWS